MLDTKTAPFGALILRVVTGFVLIVHTLVHLTIVFSNPAGFFESYFLAVCYAYILFGGLLSGIALIIGFYARYASILFLPAMIGITYHAPMAKEYPAFISAVLFVQFLLGDGVWALKKSPKLWSIRKSSDSIKALSQSI